jgi:hypothetical protein
MGAQLFLNLFASALLGSVFFISYYYLSQGLGTLVTLALLLFVTLIIVLFWLWREYAPNLDFLSFLEDYGEGKLGYKKGRSQRHAPQKDREQAHEEPTMAPEGVESQGGELGAQGAPQPFAASEDNKKDSKERSKKVNGKGLSKANLRTRFFSFVALMGPKAWAKKQSQKEKAPSHGMEGELVTVSTPPGPIFAGGVDLFKNSTNLTRIYRYIEKGEYDHALQGLKKIAPRHSGKKVVQNDLGVLYYMQRKWEQALLELQRVEAEAEDSLILQYNIALAMLKLKKNHEAIDRLQSLLERREMPQALFHLAVLFYRIGHKDKADRMLKRAQELGYDYSPVWPPEG